MTLQNRVTPEGEIVAVEERGLLMGNRGGRLHKADRTLGARRWVSRQWIACVLSFRGRQRDVMGPRSYTELFFLDEATALAAGHRPCFECRRADAVSFSDAWRRATRSETRPKAAEMDLVLHEQRLEISGGKRIHEMTLDEVPPGVMVRIDGAARLVTSRGLRTWTPGGYGEFLERAARCRVDVLTPPAIVAVISAGYRPMLHPTAEF